MAISARKAAQEPPLKQTLMTDGRESDGRGTESSFIPFQRGQDVRYHYTQIPMKKRRIVQWVRLTFCAVGFALALLHFASCHSFASQEGVGKPGGHCFAFAFGSVG
jgi:hypothetical protein